MPEQPKRVKLTSKHIKRPALNSTERGYDAAHQRQQKILLGQFPLCQRCGLEFSAHLHHKDRNPFNKDPGNAEAICERCHIKEHQRPA